jgi:molybdopterin-guanine dinucleotide biosynthesis protein A
MVVPDTRDGYQGPLAGLEAVAAHISTDYVALAGCDMPHLPPDFVDRLLTALENSRPADLAYAHDGHRDQYLCALVRSSCLTTLGAFLDGGQRAVRDWYRTRTCIAVDFSDRASDFRNYNSLVAMSETGNP